MRYGLWLPTVNRRVQAGIFLSVALFAGAAGFYIRYDVPGASVADSAVQKLMLASFADLSGKQQMLALWRGKVLVVNYWATWCAPCRDEIPALMNVQRQFASNRVQFVGIAIDNASKVREFADEMRIDYSLLIGGLDTIDTSKNLGNSSGVLPFTLVLDSSGKVRYAHAGAITEAALIPVLRKLL